MGNIDRSYTNASGSSDTIAAITGVDLDSRTAQAWSPSTLGITVGFGLMSSGIYVIPRVGQQWVVSRTGRSTWVLVSMAPHDDERLNQEPAEGLTAIGLGGPTRLTGSTVEIDGPLLINGVLYAPYVDENGDPAPTPVAKTDRLVRFGFPISSNTITISTGGRVLPFQIKTGDTDNHFELLTDGTVKCNRAGNYRLTARIGATVPANIDVGVNIQIGTLNVSGNSTWRGTASSSVLLCETSDVTTLAVGDIITVAVYLSADVQLTVNQGYRNRLTISYTA